MPTQSIENYCGGSRDLQFIHSEIHANLECDSYSGGEEPLPAVTGEVGLGGEERACYTPNTGVTCNM